MLLVRPDVEERLRSELALLREKASLMDSDVADRKLKRADELERKLDAFKQRDEFKKISEEYWSDNDVQLSTMSSIFDEISEEIERINSSLEQAQKMKKRSLVLKLQKKGKELDSALRNIFEFVPCGGRTGGYVKDVCGAWAKQQETKNRLESLREIMEKHEETGIPIEKRLAAATKRLERIEGDFKKKNATASDVQTQRNRVKEVEEQKAAFERELSEKKQRLASMEKSFAELHENITKTIVKLSRMSETNRLSEGAGTPLKNMYLGQSLPRVRRMIGTAVRTLPRKLLDDAQIASVKKYEEIHSKVDESILKAKNSARGKRSKEAVEALMNGAVDHDSEEIKHCAQLLEDGDIHLAERAVEHAFKTGNIHQYIKEELMGIIKEIEKEYDKTGDVSKFEGELRSAGNAMYSTRIDVMRFDYIASGVHSPRIFWEDAVLTYNWLESIGILFEESLKKNIENSRGKPEFMKIANVNGFTPEQKENAADLMNMLSFERELLKKLRNSEIVERVRRSEESISSLIMAKGFFDNPIFLKNLEEGEEHAVNIKERIFARAGDNLDAIEIYFDIARKRELLGELQTDMSDAAEALGQVKQLCNEVGELKKSIAQSKANKAITLKISLGRKIKELEDVVERIIGQHLDEEAIAQISDPKKSGKKLYAEITNMPLVAQAVKNRVNEEREILSKLIEKPEEMSTPINDMAAA